MADGTGWSHPILTGHRWGGGLLRHHGGFLSTSSTCSAEICSTSGPAKVEGVGPILADLAYNDDYPYVGSEEGTLHVVDISGALMKSECEFDARSPIRVSPIIDEGVVYVPTVSRQMWTFPEGDCAGRGNQSIAAVCRPSSR